MKITFFVFLSSCVSIQDNDKSDIDPGLLGKKGKQEWLFKTNTMSLYSSYQPDQNDLQKFKNLISGKEYAFVIFSGFECPDCHENIPKILKIFDSAGIEENDYSIYVLDNKLEEPGGIHNNFDIPTTPSLFITNKDRKVGLITYPDYNWLEMMIDIIREDLNEK